MSPLLDIIKSIPLFQNCTDTFFETLSADMQVKDYNKDHLLFLNGDEARRFYYIQSGWVKLFRETLDGSQAVIDVLPARHVFAETAIFEENHHSYSAEIVEPAQIISLPLAALKNEIGQNNKLALDMLESMARYRRQREQELEHQSLQNAPQRIGCFLLRLADQNTTGPVKIQLPYDKRLVASRLQMQPETFSRALKKLKEKTDIKIQGATIELDSLDQLVNYSCAACTSEFPCKDLQSCR